MSEVDSGDRDESGRVLEEEIWTHAGLRCRVVKLGMGHYCGYVRSSLSDRWNYDDFGTWKHRLLTAHGGLTYGVDEEGWVGFDCAHAGDHCVDEDGEPWGTMDTISKDRVWTLEDVKEETEELAEQVDVVQDFVEKVKRFEANGGED